MTDPWQHPRDGRSHYGAGWQQPPAPGPGTSAGPGAFPPPRPPRATRRPGDPTRAFAPGASRSAVAGAAIAVVGVLAVQAVSGLAGMLGTSLYIDPFGFHGGQNIVLQFAIAVFLSPFPFYAGAFLTLAFLTPVARRSPLPVVLLRAVLGGVGGTVALALVGVFTGASGAVTDGPRRLVLDVVTGPLQRGVPLTAMLLAAATVAWLWLGRPRATDRTEGRRAGAPGTPGTVRPADAVPPAAFPQQPPRPPADPWQPPRR